MRHWLGSAFRGPRGWCRETSASGLAEAPAALVRALFVIAGHPGIEVELQRLHRIVDLLAEGDTIELIQQRFVEPLADPVGLRALRPGPRVFDILDGEVEIILVAVV